MSEIRSQATPARDELAGDIREVDGNHSLGASALADRLVDRGWSKPRTVNSAAELDALPVGSVVRDKVEWVGEIVTVAGRKHVFWAGNECEAGLDEIALPATVLFTPGDAG